uniref:Uncharacterized protein n=1 Tax=uncultured Thiotrichaceae bacterium TaxID=298394 RepID=A0A6S6UEY3_9GAMM|nr:MAG: Unknown protein [uncultured Thiotrichaceae bacterium]
MPDMYRTGLEKNPANYQPLTPMTFLERSASVFPNHTAIVHGKQSVNGAFVKVLNKIVFAWITDTSTGEIQKFAFREHVRELEG